MTIVPNSFATPNAFVDQAMEYLTCEEYKCLSFATRHILGWKDKISARRGKISLTMFEHGYTSEKGVHYGGTGLSRAAIIKATDKLHTFGFLVKVGEPDSDGQEWELGDEPDWNLLRARKAEQQAANQARTAKAREKQRLVGLTGECDTPQVVSATDQQRLVGLTESNLSSKPIQNQGDGDNAPAREAFNIFSLYHQTFGQLAYNPILLDDLKDMAATFPPDWITEAFEMAGKANARHHNYAWSVLRGWRDRGKGTRPAPPGSSPAPPLTPHAPVGVPFDFHRRKRDERAAKTG